MLMTKSMEGRADQSIETKKYIVEKTRLKLESTEAKESREKESTQKN